MISLKKLAKQIFKYEAKLILKKYKPKIIAISGSVGKTGAKEAIFLVLSKKFFIRKTEKSLTAEVGIPLTIIGCSQGTGSLFQWIENIFIGLNLLVRWAHYPEWLILEIDADKPGDLRGISNWLKPDILVLTAIGEVPAHIELFRDIETFLAEKKALIDSTKRDGVIIYNIDDFRTSNLLLQNEVEKISCGMGESSDISGSDFSILYSSKPPIFPTGMSFAVISETIPYALNIFGSIGINNEYASLIAFGVGKYLKINPEEIILSLGKYRSLPGRMNLILGIKDSIILDDSYNSSPIALSQAIDCMSRVNSEGKKIAVIGDMLELGKYSSLVHKKVANELIGKVSNVYTVGFRSKKIADALLDLGFDENNLLSFDTVEEASATLQNQIQKGDIVLVKGSQAIRMEKVVEEVMKHPEDKKKFLVRQEAEWIGR